MDGYEDDGSNAGGYGNDGGLGADNVFGAGFLTRARAAKTQVGWILAASTSTPAEGWSDMQGYQDLLRTGRVQGSHGPPPVRVPPRSGNRTLGLRGAHNGRGGDGSACVGGGGSPFVGGSFVPTMPREHVAPSGATDRPRRRGGRRRAAAVQNFPHAVCAALFFFQLPVLECPAY
jgi:hypothetical protein